MAVAPSAAIRILGNAGRPKDRPPIAVTLMKRLPRDSRAVQLTCCALVVASVSACSDVTRVCDLGMPIAIFVTLRDSISGQLLYPPSTITASSTDAPFPGTVGGGGAADSISGYVGGFGGVYDITAAHAGYLLTTARVNVLSTGGQCPQPVSRHVTIRMPPS